VIQIFVAFVLALFVLNSSRFGVLHNSENEKERERSCTRNDLSDIFLIFFNCFEKHPELRAVPELRRQLKRGGEAAVEEA
jgi:hypothetical protein